MPQCRKEPKQLKIIKGLVAEGAIHFSKKVQKKIENGWFRLEDIRHCVKSATEIQKIETDDLGKAQDGYKYTILGLDTEGYQFYTCGKIIVGGNDEKLYFFITAHEDEAT